MENDSDFVEDLFEAAVPLSKKERADLLDRRCKDAPELRRAVETLLAAYDDAGSFLDNPLVNGSHSVSDSLNAKQGTGSQTAPFHVGSVVAGRFIIHRFVARGGMGEVWEAWDSQVQERVALKSIRADLARNPEVLERFRREVKQARTISHSNVCRIHELFSFDNAADEPVLFLCMEYLEGSTLSDYIRHHGAFEPDAAYPLVDQLVQGLKTAHSLGVVHRDLKSKNIMLVSSAPGNMRAVITDFGLALNVLRPEGDLEERPGQGTPAYMAPEQKLTGQVTALADQYALGVIMCEMVTGARPVRKESSSSRKAVGMKLPGNSIPMRWANTILRALSAQPADRFENLDDLLAALKPPIATWLLVAASVAIACVLAGTAAWLWRAHPADTTSLAVLPLRNGSGDSNLDYVSSGFTEALTNDLAVMPGLKVKAAGIAEHYTSANSDPGESGKRLNVSSVVNGSFFEGGGHVRVPIEIIDVNSGSQVWGKTYEGDVSNLAELQSEISTDVAYHLKVQLNPDLRARIKRQYSTNSVAYNAYLKGRFRLTQRSQTDLRSAVELFQTALEADPKYAPSYAGLADAYGLLAHYSAGDQIPMMKNALKTANQALALDPTLGEAYASRAWARVMLNYEWKEGESDYQRALELHPNYLNARIWYALGLLAPLGRDEEAQGQLAYVQAADPASMLTNITHGMVAQCAGRTEESAQVLEEQLRSTPTFEPAVEVLSVDYLELKRQGDAIHLLLTQPVETQTKNQRNLMLGIAYAQLRDWSNAQHRFDLASNGDAQNAFPFQVALYYTSVGNHDKALDSLELAYTERDSDLLFVRVNPLLRPLHSSPRFQKLLRDMNFE